MSAQSDAVYGRGISYPMRVSSRGGIQQSGGEQKVDESIRMILGTQYGERVMRPTFGCNLRSLAFAPNNESTAQLAQYYVEEGLKEWEPRIELMGVTVTNNHALGALIIEIHYRLRATQDIRSMVYPFSLAQA